MGFTKAMRDSKVFSAHNCATASVSVRDSWSRYGQLCFDDLYQNLRVFENDVKGHLHHLFNLQNVEFVSGKNTASVSTEDANQNFLRSLPSAWLQVSLIMRNKPGIDSLSFDDLYNNLRIFENDVKSSTASSSNLPNVAFVSENTSSTNDVSTAYGVPITSGHNTKHEQTSTSTSSYSLLNLRYCGNLSYENETSQSVFNTKDSDFENLPLYKQLYKSCEMQMVPPPMTRNYMPSGPDIEIDDSQYTYGPERTQPSEFDTCNYNISTEPSELVSEPVVNESNIEVQPKVWSDAPIIEEYESDSDDECVSVQTKGLDTPSFANKQVKTPRENVKN
ncbi:hypothetical protein Tco_1524107 [Tanacetum coccineum]